MNRYEKYKPVQSYWLSGVPSHWETVKNKHVFSQQKERVGENWASFTLLTMGKSGVKPRNMEGGGKFPERFENYQVVSPNQLIFCLFDLDETPRTVGLSKDYGIITSAYDVFSVTSDNDSQYWTYFYQMIDDHKGLRPFYTGLRKVVRSDAFMSIEVFSPPLQEQKLISRYLDKKTAQIDSLIEKIQEKIELLKEQRTALINQCVTKGLNPNVEMKDSGVEWIGEIPKHWSCLGTSKVFINIGTGTTPSPNNEDYYSDQGYHWITTSDLNEGAMYDTLTKITQKSLEDYPNLTLYPSNSVYISMYGGRIGKSGISTFESYCNQSVCVLPGNTSIVIQFYYYWFSGYQSFVKGMGRGGGQPNINKEMIKKFPTVKVPFLEQKQISRYLDKKTDQIDSLIGKIQKKVALHKEYRQSLISSVVTGKVRVTEDMV